MNARSIREIASRFEFSWNARSVPFPFPFDENSLGDSQSRTSACQFDKFARRVRRNQELARGTRVCETRVPRRRDVLSDIRSGAIRDGLLFSSHMASVLLSALATGMSVKPFLILDARTGKSPSIDCSPRNHISRAQLRRSDAPRRRVRRR